jgi:hypothetical protein
VPQPTQLLGQYRSPGLLATLLPSVYLDKAVARAYLYAPTHAHSAQLHFSPWACLNSALFPAGAAAAGACGCAHQLHQPALKPSGHLSSSTAGPVQAARHTGAPAVGGSWVGGWVRARLAGSTCWLHKTTFTAVQAHYTSSSRTRSSSTVADGCRHTVAAAACCGQVGG